jgi:hypothetical protein
VVTTGTETAKNRRALADMAIHLSKQLAADIEALETIKARWDANGRCQAEDLMEHQRAHPIPDPLHELYIALSGIGVHQDSVDTEIHQAINAAEYLMTRLRLVEKLAAG